MFEIKVTVDAPELALAINHLAEAFHAGQFTPAVPALSDALVDTPVSDSKPDVAPAPVPAAPASPTASAAPVDAPVAPAEPKPAPAKVYTFDQISKAGAKLCTDIGKMDQLVTLLNTKYGVPAITMIDKKRYAELADDLINLGAVIEEE